jgi:pyridoxal/pyridoxine/pyridoxamine kinase
LQDWVGAMVSNNTESGINVTYDDATGTLDFTVTASGTGDVTTAQLADSMAYVRNTVAAVTAGATTIALDANSLMNRVFQVDMTSASTASTITLSHSPTPRRRVCTRYTFRM